MRILLINQYYPPDTAPTGQLLSDLAKALVEQGHNVHVLCSRRTYGGGDVVLSAEQILDGAYIHRVNATGFGRGMLLGRLLDYLSFYVSATFRAMIMPRMDVSVSLTTPPFISIIGLLLLRLKRTKMILWTMDLYPEVAVAYGYLKKQSLIHRISSAISRYLYKTSFCIVSIGDVMTERLMEAGAQAEKIVTVHNWAPSDNFVETYIT